MEVKLLRIDSVGKGVRGIMFVPGKQVVHRQPITTIENAEYTIPDGSYNLAISYSPKFKKYTPEVMNVKNRSGIRIHTGVRPEQSNGCILTTANGFETIYIIITEAARVCEPVKLIVKTTYNKS